MKKILYCTLDTETWGGASRPKGIYHLAGIIHDRDGNVQACFNYVIAEHYHKIDEDSYSKKNFLRYAAMVQTGITTMIDTEDHAIEMVSALLDFYDVRYLMAFNTGFDFVKTSCKKLLEGREFIDIWLMALQTLAIRKKYSTFCRENNFRSSSKKSVSTSAQTVYAYITNNPEYCEEHTALKDAEIEMQIFLQCVKAHKKYTKNCHVFDFPGSFNLFPRF